MQTGQGKYGMQTMNQALYELVVRKQITKETALQRSSVQDELNAMFNRGGMMPPSGGLKDGKMAHV
jgi:twitching motility protein PilT